MRGLTSTSIARSAKTVATPRAARMSTTAAVRHQPAKAPAPEPSPAPSTSASSSSPLPRRTPGTPLNAPTTSGGPHESAAYCASLVQKLDPDAWLCSYFWPRREKEWWLAIRAFNLELHLVSTTVTQPAIAAMRFQFWRDALSAIFSDGAKPLPQHPVVVALAAARAHRPVQKYYLSQLIEARAKAMSQPPAASTLEGHLSAAGQVASALLQGSLPLLVAPTDAGTPHLAHTLSHLAHLLTVTSLLRAVPALVAKRELNFPADVKEQHGVVDEEVFRKGAAADGFRDAAFTIATRGIDELITARRDLKKDDGKVVPAAGLPIFLSAVPAERYLKRLEQADFDVFSPQLQKHDWRLAPSIFWAAQTGKI